MLFISTIPKIHHTKLHLMVNLMVYVCRSRCKCFSPHIPGQTFLRFDFSKHPYAYGRDRVPDEREIERERVKKVCVRV